MELHIRTKIRYEYSFITSAALKIGSDTLEVSSHGNYMVDSISRAELPTKISGYLLSYEHIDGSKEHKFDVDLGSGQHIYITTFKDFVSVNFHVNEMTDSVGLLGHFHTGTMLSRNGTTILEDDPIAFGQEWQVLDTEPKLFQAERPPQYPQACILPDPKKKSGRRRRLGASIAREAAEKACAHRTDNKEACIFDCMATGDLEMAQAGGY